MRVTPTKPGVKPKWTEEEITSKTSWVTLVAKDVWEKITEAIHLGSEYPKGTQTVSKHITYTSYLNKVVEQIRLAAKPRFRTETEIFRIAIHIGLTVLYTIFITNKESVGESRGFFFYKALADLNSKMERATIVSIIKEKTVEMMELVKKNCMTIEDGNDEINELLKTLTPADREYVTSFITTSRMDNVKDINESLLKKLMGCQ